MKKLATSELAWTQADYAAHGQPHPVRLNEHPGACEGQLMSDEEIQLHIRDSLQTLYLLKDAASVAMPAVRAAFWADLEFLLSIGRLTAARYEEVMALEAEQDADA